MIVFLAILHETCKSSRLLKIIETPILDDEKITLENSRPGETIENNGCLEFQESGDLFSL